MSKLPDNCPDLIMLIDKPYTWTSFDVVRKLKFGAKLKKIGHAGTLDPLATGLLIVASGKFTKKLTEIQGCDKEYTGIISLGATTPCYDLERPFDAYYPTGHITEEMIMAASKTFLGEQFQIPPKYSALKQDGKPIYKKAHKGKAEEVEVKPRRVFIHEFEIVKIEMPDIHFRIKCSSGTYIRSIAHDIGKVLESGSHLSELRRTKVGEFKVEDAMEPLDFIEKHKLEFPDRFIDVSPQL
jgi:tRNA pseudouridine55 synthase